MQELIKEFTSQKRFAAVGATDNPQKYGNQIVKNLIHFEDGKARYDLKIN